MMKNYDVFISYRRNGGFETARHLYDLLVRDGYSVSFDLDTLREGAFNMQLLSRIDECEDFIIIIDQHAFDRTLDPTFDPRMDWMRIELSHALSKDKNVVPVLLSGAGFPETLPEDIRQVIYKNGPEYSQGYFDAFYQKLKAFLHSKPFERQTTVFHNLASVTFYSDQPCYVKEAGKVLGEVQKEGTSIYLQKGKHRLVFVKKDKPVRSFEEDVLVEETGVSQTVDISFLSHPQPMDSVAVKRASDLVDKAMKIDKESDGKTVFALCREAAETGYPEGLFRLALCYLEGMGVNRDSREGMRLLKCVRQLADQGNEVAQYCRGLCYDEGIDIETGGEYDSDDDDVEAAKWYRRSAERGFFKAQYELGCAYRFGFGVEEDENEAVKWIRRSADQGYGTAQTCMGICYLNGVGELPEDAREAVNWFRRAAAQENDWGQYWLGRCYYGGTGVEEDNTKAVKYFTLAAEQGDEAAQYYLGICHYNGYGVPENKNEAVKWCRRAAEKGYTEAETMLGDCYCLGRGVKENDAEAIKWYRRAAGDDYSGDSHAQYMLGMYYYHGDTVSRDYSQAIKWFTLSAEQGDANAKWALARCYLKGRGVPKSRIEALKWFYAIPEEERKGTLLDLAMED